MPSRSYWIGVMARDHAFIGVAGGYTQVTQGKAAPLERMHAGDGFAFYSPRTAHPDGPPLQAFTAIGRVRDGNIWQTEASEGFRPFRRAVDYLPAREAPIKPLLPHLTFIRNKVHWGAPFRYGFLRVPEEDFARIAAAMGRDFAADFPADDAPSADCATADALGARLPGVELRGADLPSGDSPAARLPAAAQRA
jgi:EVE domain